MTSEETLVLVLDDGPDGESTPWGWKGHIVFRGRWTAKPVDMAREMTQRLGDALDLHAVVHHSGLVWIVLRRATEYRVTQAGARDSSIPVSQTRIRAGVRHVAATSTSKR